MTDLIKIIFGLGVLYFLWKKKKVPVPVLTQEQEREEIEGRLIGEFIQDDNQEFFENDISDPAVPAVLPAGLSVIEDLATTAPAALMTDYAVQEAANFKLNYDLARELAAAPYVTFILTNVSAAAVTIDVLKSESTIDPDGRTGDEVPRLMDFDGVDNKIVMSANVPVSGSKKITFKMWLDLGDYTTDGTLIDFYETNFLDSLLVMLIDNYLYFNASNLADTVYSIDISGLKKLVLEVTIEKILNATKGEITKITIKEEGTTWDYTLQNPGGLGVITGGGNTIGGRGAFDLLNQATIWDVKIYDTTGIETLVHAFAGFPARDSDPAGNVDESWNDSVGSLTAYVAGLPATRTTRDLKIGSIETPAGGESTFQAYDSVNIDLNINPVVAWHLKIITSTTAQLLKPIAIKNKTITGKEANQFLQVQNWVSAQNKNQTSVDIPLSDLYFDDDSYFEYILDPNEVVTLIFYYRQADVKDKMVKVDQFINVPL